jgi:hypothetical protein
MLLLQACSSTKPYTLGPVKTFDPDTTRIPEPEENESYQYWDRIDNTIFHQIEKPLDLNRVFRSMGSFLNLAGAKQADNINTLDEPPESSWYNYRHYYDPMSLEELAIGPNTVQPDTTGTWTIFSGKLEGANPGFFIEDVNDNRFLIKFDGSNYPELTTSAEVIGTKIFYAAGYNVPESVITYFNPGNVTIGEDVIVMDEGKERPMTMADYQSIIVDKPRDDKGNVRALASKFVDGIPVGQWAFEGTRSDDPNDRVAHEHRREIRGMRILSSWLNDTDRRDANTMAVYTDEGYIKHYVQDFGNTLGANGSGIHEPIYGQAYLIDPRYMTMNTFTLGLMVNTWENIDAEDHIPYPSVGYFRSEVFKPGRWVSAHPLPAYENMTLRDAFWGAKQVMSFTDEDIRAIVETGKITNPNAEEYVINVLTERRDKIGRYWFRRINPVDKFSTKDNGEEILLSFHDLGIETGIFNPLDTYYEYSVSVVDGDILLKDQQIQKTDITIDESLITDRDSDKRPLVLKFEIITHRTDPEAEEKSTWVYVAFDASEPRIAGVEREE